MSQKRQPPGVPVGGQFAGTTRSEAEVPSPAPSAEVEQWRRDALACEDELRNDPTASPFGSFGSGNVIVERASESELREYGKDLGTPIAVVKSDGTDEDAPSFDGVVFSDQDGRIRYRGSMSKTVTVDGAPETYSEEIEHQADGDDLRSFATWIADASEESSEGFSDSADSWAAERAEEDAEGDDYRDVVESEYRRAKGF